MKRQYEDFFMKNSARKESLKKHLTRRWESVEYAAQADDLASKAMHETRHQRSLTI